MNNSFLDEFKNAWGKPNNGLVQLILINVIVFVVLGVILVFSTLAQSSFIFDTIYNQLSLPSSLSSLIFKPWTIMTYAFVHSFSGLWHILWNMLVMYWFGRLIMEYLGSQKMISLYVLGALGGAVAYVMIYNLIPYYSEAVEVSRLVGASASVLCIAVAAATLMPDYVFHLLFIGPVRIKYIVAVIIFLSFLGSIGSNAGGEIAHLGGAAMGYIYIRQLQGGNDIGNWVIRWITFFKSFFSKQSKIKVTHKNTGASGGRSTSTRSSASSSTTDQDEIDAILDKISKSGYESLSKSEKQKLFNASKK